MVNLGEVNDEIKKQFMHLHPEVGILIERLNNYKGKDKFFYREFALNLIIANTSKDDMEILGVLARMMHTANTSLDAAYKDRKHLGDGYER